MKTATLNLDKIDYSVYLTEDIIEQINKYPAIFSGSFKSMAIKICDDLHIDTLEPVMVEDNDRIIELNSRQYFTEQLMKYYFTKIKESIPKQLN